MHNVFCYFIYMASCYCISSAEKNHVYLPMHIVIVVLLVYERNWLADSDGCGFNIHSVIFIKSFPFLSCVKTLHNFLLCYFS